MPTTENTVQQQEDLESQVWSAIAAFEQIVEMIPNDRVSLEALSHAYEQVGDLSRAREYLTRLANLVIEEKDHAAAEMLKERLARFSPSDPAARDTEHRLDSFLLTTGKESKDFDFESKGKVVDEETRKAEEAERKGAHVASELSFAWTLFQAGELSQEEYAAVAQDLSTVSANATPVTVSVLHTLHDRGSRNLEKVTAFAARDSGVPVIPLSLFEVPEAAFSLIPRDFMVRYGVMAFEVMGTDVLVVTLNPYNKSLRDKVASMIGRRCHFFLTLPSEFDTLLERRVRNDAPRPETKAAATP